MTVSLKPKHEKTQDWKVSVALAQSKFFYVRVSGKHQSIERQVASCLSKIQQLGYDVSEFDMISDEAVSANVVPLASRRGISNLLRMIRNGEVELVIVDDRDRIARNMIEYLRVWSTCQQTGTRLILANPEATPVSNDFVVEAELALHAEIDGKNIANRTRQQARFYPPAPFGYKKEGKKGDTHYVPTSEKDISIVQAIFLEFRSLHAESDYPDFQMKWKARIGRDVTKILTNLLYAASIMEEDGRLTQVIHIDPIVPVSEILKNINTFVSWGLVKDELDPEFPITRFDLPIECRRCNSVLEPRLTRGEYKYCCPSCRAVRISINKYEEAMEQFLINLLGSLDAQRIRSTTLAVTQRLARAKKSEMQLCLDKLQRLEKELAINLLDEAKVEMLLHQCHELQKVISLLRKERVNLENMSQNLERIVTLVGNKLETIVNDDVYVLCEVLVRGVYADEHIVEVEHYPLFQQKGELCNEN